MKIFLGLLLGLALGVGGMWLYVSHRDDPAVRRFGQQVGSNTVALKEAVQNKLTALHLTPQDIQEELSRGGQVVRRAATDLGRSVADKTADARITAAIKARYLADQRLSALRISVNCTEGRVTLSGTVSTTEDIGRAMLIAMEVDPGVQEVVSTLQVRK
jgi:lipopolysaccharide export system protein LptC